MKLSTLRLADLLPWSRSRRLRRRNRSHKQLVASTSPRPQKKQRDGTSLAEQALARCNTFRAVREAAEVDRVARTRAGRCDEAAFVLQSHWRAHARLKTLQIAMRRPSFPAPPPRCKAAEKRSPSFEFELPTPPRTPPRTSPWRREVTQTLTLPTILTTPAQYMSTPMSAPMPATPPSLDEVAAVVLQASARRRAAQQRREAMEANASPAERPHRELKHQLHPTELAKALHTMVRHLPTLPHPPSHTTPTPLICVHLLTYVALHTTLLTPARLYRNLLWRREATFRSVKTRRSGWSTPSRRCRCRSFGSPHETILSRQHTF